MRKIVEIKRKTGDDGLYVVPFSCDYNYKKIGKPLDKYKFIYSAIISAVDEFNRTDFSVVQIKENGFDLKFEDNDNIFYVPYYKYCVIDNVFYERTEFEINVYLRKDKIKFIMEKICQ